MRVLVLGAYGLIGLAISRALIGHGHEVVGLARSQARGQKLLPQARWIGADIATLTAQARWAPHLDGIDAVVNAAGVMQSGGRDDVAATQRDAIVALIAACEAVGHHAGAEARPVRFIQISAPGVAADSTTEFYRTKADADAALAASGLDWTIFRPGLVLAPTAYGGSAMLRTLAAFPLIQPLTMSGARVQTVSMDDVNQAVIAALDGAGSRGTYDLVEDQPHTLAEIVAAMRAWLGFRPARRLVTVGPGIGSRMAKAADLAGRLGWRSALRTTAMKVLEDGVLGDPAPWRAVTGRPLNSLTQTLWHLPSTVQERLYARWLLVFPIALLTLAAFWIVTGLVTLARVEAAAAIIADQVGPGTAAAAVVLGALLDIAIGAGLLIRRTVRPACWAAIGVTGVYLVLGTILTPHLWADPLGVFVKAIPAMVLALVVAALAEER